MKIENLKGIGEKTAEIFHKLGIFDCEDLINYYPRAYDKYELPVSISQAILNNRNSILATIKSAPKLQRFNGKTIISFLVYDDNNDLCEVKFFNTPYIAKTIKAGEKKIFRGYTKIYKGHLIIDHPKIYKPDDYKQIAGTIVPIYHLTKDISSERIAKFVKLALENYDILNEYLTGEELNNFKMINYNEAIQNIHFPFDDEMQFFARRRIVFEEFLHFISISKGNKLKESNYPNNFKMIEVSDLIRLEEQLPFALTNAQKAAVQDIVNDLTGPNLMNRLVQGDVGSGKTIVAIMALLLCASNGYQGAMMAPTEVLARQHYETIKQLSEKYKLSFNPVLLTGKMSLKAKREVLSKIETGEANVILGTHALIVDNVSFKDLALVITDEQHRFGVKQREAFALKGKQPHLLVMSATPIPRTLAMILFADLSVSVINELPQNRIPIMNCVVDSTFRNKAYEKIKSEIDKGHQAYVICPMISDNEESELDLKSVEQHSLELADYFGPKYRICTLDGKMKAAEKSRVMDEFKNRNIDILVSTTVIEVGIDVPNATVIMVENAERFGLSQLHQLRGRVGRGEYESYCILLSDSKNDNTIRRLKILNETNDGFKIAEEDLKLRGPGELNGVRQSGELQFGLGDFVYDGDLMIIAAKAFDDISKRTSHFDAKFIDFRSI